MPPGPDPSVPMGLHLHFGPRSESDVETEAAIQLVAGLEGLYLSVPHSSLSSVTLGSAVFWTDTASDSRTI